MADAPLVTAISESSPITVADVSPTPTDAEVVAIMAGVQALWPKPAIVADKTPARTTTWRFSGRWWSRPIPTRRDRPFR